LVTLLAVELAAFRPTLDSSEPCYIHSVMRKISAGISHLLLHYSSKS